MTSNAPTINFQTENLFAAAYEFLTTKTLWCLNCHWLSSLDALETTSTYWSALFPGTPGQTNSQRLRVNSKYMWTCKVPGIDYYMFLFVSDWMDAQPRFCWCPQQSNWIILCPGFQATLTYPTAMAFRLVCQQWLEHDAFEYLDTNCPQNITRKILYSSYMYMYTY